MPAAYDKYSVTQYSVSSILGYINAGDIAVSYTHLDVYKRQAYQWPYRWSQGLSALWPLSARPIKGHL